MRIHEEIDGLRWEAGPRLKASNTSLHLAWQQLNLLGLCSWSSGLKWNGWHWHHSELFNGFYFWLPFKVKHSMKTGSNLYIQRIYYISHISIGWLVELWNLYKANYTKWINSTSQHLQTKLASNFCPLDILFTNTNQVTGERAKERTFPSQSQFSWDDVFTSLDKIGKYSKKDKRYSIYNAEELQPVNLYRLGLINSSNYLKYYSFFLSVN